MYSCIVSWYLSKFKTNLTHVISNKVCQISETKHLFKSYYLINYEVHVPIRL